MTIEINSFEKASLGNKSYSRRHGTYNALWLDDDGKPAFWGSYNPDDGSYYLAVPGRVLASGSWLERENGNYEFQSCGTYLFDDVRKAIQCGFV